MELAFICYKSTKKYRKSRLNSQSEHLITLLTIPQITIDEIFLDDGNVLCSPTDCKARNVAIAITVRSVI